MKKFIILSVIGAAAATSLTGCYDLTPEPGNQYVTEDQKKEVLEANPEMARAGVTGITAIFSSYQQVYSNHLDFGVPSVMLMNDSRGQDMVAEDIGYNWFSSLLDMSYCNPDSYLSNMAWRHYYKQVFACNALIKSIDPETEDAELQFYLAQGLAMRANDYFNLIQYFAPTYDGNASAAGVMLITEKNSDDVAVNGIKRATVQETYDFILSDLDKAIELIEASGIRPEQVLDSKPKRLVSKAVAYGLRARVNLVMHNMTAAADDAKAAIQAFTGRPLTLAAASEPGFGDITASNWMWGIAIAETDRVVTSGIINFPSHMGSLNYGYASVGAWRMINTQLYDAIPATDVRKGWFLDADGQSANLTAAQQAYCDGKSMSPYTQVKFAPYKGELGTSENACDIPLMRIEEMYYIFAEANQDAGLLTQFVQQYRDPSFAVSGDLTEAIWNQRRVEFFGEGLTFFDVLRLHKGINRVGGGYEETMTFKIPADAQLFTVPIPRSEINGNKQFTEADNNPSVPMPDPVTE